MHIPRLFFILLAILAVVNVTQARLEVLRAWRHPEPSSAHWIIRIEPLCRSPVGVFGARVKCDTNNYRYSLYQEKKGQQLGKCLMWNPFANALCTWQYVVSRLAVVIPMIQYLA